MWRYRELLPIDGEPTIGLQVGFTPLVNAGRLAAKLGVRSLYIKNDTVNYPTLSFKDRVVSVALNQTKELGFQTVALRFDGQSRQFRGCERGQRRAEELRAHSRGSGAGQSARIAGLWHQCHRHFLAPTIR